MDVLIEQASSEEAEAILELQKLAYQDEAEIYQDYNIPPLTQTLEGIKAEFGKLVFLKVIADGKLVGSARAYEQENTCYIGRLIVHPAYQNRGIGTKLIDGIEQHFNEVARYELFTGYKSTRNLYLYQKLGYKVFKEENLSERVRIVFLEKIR
jgi:ribosomal protein S18 acetylase RimI-like enzyme